MRGRKDDFYDAEKLDTHLSTIASLCSIRNTMNTTDEFYEAEMAYLNENLPNLIPAEKAMKEDIVNGPFRADFEKEYGAHFIAVLENDLKTQDERIIPELVKESELSVEYSKAAASCKVDFRGETCNFYGLLKHMESTDRESAKKRLKSGRTFTRAFPTSSMSCTISSSKCAWRWRRSSAMTITPSLRTAIWADWTTRPSTWRSSASRSARSSRRR